ncbi:MFS transporter [Homoserinimonas sp. OAct 916]|uniref:MFS transporter n=1 Tax=Homoserinimonas sp. OAct 916 TaxID=2211450 RepID=UPI000DBE484D|nr:MFS transporter [Homoserinimonas sp. OAct 916]
MSGPRATAEPGRSSSASILHQPKAVWAVAAASVVAFMGIGLVDPILPAIAESLNATPTQTELLFTSYLLVTGVAMFFTSWLSSRIGAKKTLMIGLALIVLFAFAAGMAPSVEAIIGFRAGWGLGNALFISTALATIVGAASGGRAEAIILYEAALGLGIAVGPLLGGLLGSWAWQGPFFGTAILMAVGLIAIAVFLKTDGARPTPTALTAPLKALRIPALGVLATAALFYNIGFFVLLAYTPFPLGLDAMGLGFTFFGWGVGLAVTSVFVAPLLTARMPARRVLALMLPLLAADLIAAGLLINSTVGLIICVIFGGLVLGVLNTVFTESVMSSTDLPHSVASSAYSGVRFLGGAIAPPAAALIAVWLAPQAAYYFGAGAVVVALIVILAGNRVLARVQIEPEDDYEKAQMLTAADA